MDRQFKAAIIALSKVNGALKFHGIEKDTIVLLSYQVSLMKPFALARACTR